MARLVTRNGKLLRLPSGSLGKGGSVNFEYTNCESEDLYVYEQCATYTCKDEVIETIDISEGGTITNITSPTSGNGTLVISGGGTTLTYTPDTGFTGVDVMEYELDGVTNRDRYVVVNAQPVTTTDSEVAQTQVTATLDVLANDSSPNGRPLTLESVTDPANGTATIVDNKIEYTSDAAYEGADTFDYTVSDGLCEATETVNMEVVPYPVTNCDAVSANCENPYVPGKCPQMVMKVTGAGPGTVNWCGESWTLPGESGVEKAVCPTQYYLRGPAPFSYRHRWRHSNGIFLRRFVSGYYNTFFMSKTVFSAYNNVDLYPSGTLTSFYSRSYNGTWNGNPYSTSQLGGLIAGVGKPTFMPHKFYLTDTTAAPILNNTYVATNATFEWSQGAYWS